MEWITRMVVIRAIPDLFRSFPSSRLKKRRQPHDSARQTKAQRCRSWFSLRVILRAQQGPNYCHAATDCLPGTAVRRWRLQIDFRLHSISPSAASRRHNDTPRKRGRFSAPRGAAQIGRRTLLAAARSHLGAANPPRCHRSALRLPTSSRRCHSSGSSAAAPAPPPSAYTERIAQSDQQTCTPSAPCSRRLPLVPFERARRRKAACKAAWWRALSTTSAGMATQCRWMAG